MTVPVPTPTDLPETIQTIDQWVCWRTQERDGKPTKVPLDPANGRFVSATDPDTWNNLSAAREYATEREDVGIGFVFTDDDDIVGVDLDDCRDPDTGGLDDEAAAIADKLDSYTEVSPSGTGLHVLVRGSLPDGRNRKGDVELYETARFFTVTGDHLPDTPSTVEHRPDALASVHAEYVASDDDQESAHAAPEAASIASGVNLDDDRLIARAKTAENGAKFTRLWRGSTSGYESHSEADMALCSLLAFWTGGDPCRMDRLFRESGLLREKWDEVHFNDGSTYGEKTIERAIAGTDEFYDPEYSGDELVETGAVATGTPTEAAASGPDEEALESMADRLAALESELEKLEAENDRLRDELATEREQRMEHEAQTSDRGFLARLGRLLFGQSTS